MKARRINIAIIMAALLVALLAPSCTQDNLKKDEVPVVTVDPDLLGGKDMPVRLGFYLPERPRPNTKRSVVGGDEFHDSEGNYVRKLTMLCFTVEGIYLGYRIATLEGTEHAFNQCYGRDLFTGTVPAHTARIHFLANTNQFPGFDLVGNLENVLMKGKIMVSDTSDRTMDYWGFHKENSSAELKNWLAEMVINGNDTTYVKRPGSNVHLIRDRARMELGEMTDVPETSGNQYRILQIDWIITNGLTKGFLAPYNSNAADHFDGYGHMNDDETFFIIDSTRHTPYDLSDATRYKVTDSSEMVTIYKYENGTGTIYHDNRMFLFEDDNDPADPPKIILRVKYQKHYNRTDEADQITKYHTLMFLSSDNQPHEIIRNHSYVLNINSIPYEGMGHLYFKDAVESTDYENNRTITIDDRVDDINDGHYELIIDGDATSRLYQTGANTQKTIDFEFFAVDESVSVDTVTRKGFHVEWENTPDASFAANDVTVASYNPTTGKGTITFTLGSSINAALQSGVIKLQHIETGLSRKIHIYTISQFNMFPSGATSLSLVREPDSVHVVNGVSCPVYRMNLMIPGNYPSGLYPIRVRFASTTLSPYLYKEGSSASTAVDIEMNHTENGDILDGEVLAGMNYVTTANRWNSRPVGESWDFWYFFDIISKPTTTVGGNVVEDNTAKTYTIYFADKRGLRAAANRSTDVGVFVKIKYFGDAIGVSSNTPYGS